MDVSEWLTVRGFADRLGLSDQLIYEEIRRSHLPAHKIGRVYRIRREDAERYLAAHRTGPEEGEHVPEAPVRRRRTRAKRST